MINLIKQIGSNVASPERGLLEKRREIQMMIAQSDANSVREKACPAQYDTATCNSSPVPCTPWLRSSATPFLRLQSPDGILLQVGWRVFTGSDRARAAGKQNTASALLTVKHIEPLTHTRTISERMASIPVQQVLELVKDYQT